MQRFTLYVSPHSLPTLQGSVDAADVGGAVCIPVRQLPEANASDIRVSGSLALGTSPVLVDGERAYVQSAAIVEYFSEALGSFRGPDPAARQAIREWLYWDVDALFPAIFGCYAAKLNHKKLLPLNIDPAVAAFRCKSAETAVLSLDGHLQPDEFLCCTMPTIADIFCLGDIAFAEVCGFDLERWPNVAKWAARLRALPGFARPFDLLPMHDAAL